MEIPTPAKLLHICFQPSTNQSMFVIVMIHKLKELRTSLGGEVLVACGTQRCLAPTFNCKKEGLFIVFFFELRHNTQKSPAPARVSVVSVVSVSGS